tara:strand:- start:226228 stop:227217 length:990 start_codon:yes stop_codon:yes gene_type:complete
MVSSIIPASPFILDCDTGRDDALAIWYALAKSLPLCGIVASYGNTPLENVIKNCQNVLAYYPDSVIKIVAGADKPIQHHPYFTTVVEPRQKASGNGLCNIELPVQDNPESLIYHEALADRIQAISTLIKAEYAKQGRKLTYVIIGPATNFALLCRALGDDLPTYIERVVMMGGKFDGLWHDMPWADFNIGADPYAVDIILRSNIEFCFVPMNATYPIYMTVEEIDGLKAQTDIAVQAKRIMSAHCHLFSPEPVFRFHDPMVMVALSAIEQFQEVEVTINLDEDVECFGQIDRISGEVRKEARYVRQFTLDEALIASYKAELLHMLGFAQ